MIPYKYDKLGYDTVIKQFLGVFLEKAIRFYPTFFSELGYRLDDKPDELNFVQVRLHKPTEDNVAWRSSDEIIKKTIDGNIERALPSKVYYKFKDIGGDLEEIGVFSASNGDITKEFIIGLVEDRLLVNPRVKQLYGYIIGPSQHVMTIPDYYKNPDIIKLIADTAIAIQMNILKKPSKQTPNLTFYNLYNKL